MKGWLVLQKSPEECGLLTKGVNKTIKQEPKEKKVDLLACY